MPHNVLVVDDDPAVLASFSDALRSEGFDVRTANSMQAALKELSEFPADVVLSDVRMSGSSGTDLLRLLRERRPSIEVILMTAYENMATTVEAMREGAYEFLTKPVDLDELIALLEKLDDQGGSAGVSESVGSEEGIGDPGELVGQHPSMIEVFKKIGRVARRRVTVLVTGETGTGKELAARAIHESSAWSEEPFVPVNCTAIPENLLESQLFGHVKGAFTDATSDRKGRFALAGKGTLFLDEIGDTSQDFQAKLLRVLEDGEYYPVGGESLRTTEARVIAATRRNLKRLVTEGSFREDLYFRLRVVEIELPALRERKSDIPLLTRHFLERVARDAGREQVPELTEEALAELRRYDWPGNVRELKNCLTRAVTLASGSMIRSEHLDLGGDDGTGRGGIRTMAEVEAEAIRTALRHTEGNKSEAARLLDISRSRLYRLLDKHGIQTE